MSVPDDQADRDESAVVCELPDLIGHDPEDTLETDLSSLLDMQDQRQEHASKRTSRVILAAFGFLLALGLVWYAAAETNRRKVGGLIQNVKESRRDLDQMSNPSGVTAAYDEVLAKLGTRSTDIDTATRSMGVDPSTVKEDGMDPEMKGMMGGEGRTPGERKRLVESLAHAAGVDVGKKPPAKVVDPKAPPIKQSGAAGSEEEDDLRMNAD